MKKKYRFMKLSVYYDFNYFLNLFEHWILMCMRLRLQQGPRSLDLLVQVPLAHYYSHAP
jgi:hypothetical protein